MQRVTEHGPTLQIKSSGHTESILTVVYENSKICGHFIKQHQSPERLLRWETYVNLEVQSNLLMWSPLLRDHLSLAATLFGSLNAKYSANEPVSRGHLSEAASFCPSLE